MNLKEIKRCRTKRRRMFSAGRIINILLLAMIAFAMVYPMWYVLCYSFSDGVFAAKARLLFWPVEFTTSAYEYVMAASLIPTAFGNSVFVTVVGTVLSIVTTALMAYPLSRKQLDGRKVIIALVFFTMLFSGGLIPTYLVVRDMQLLDNRWALILPKLISAYYLFIMRNFFIGLPESLEEAARIDGANDLVIAFRVMFPLSKPVLAALSLYYAVDYWNSFFDCIIYITTRDKIVITVILREILTTFDMKAITGAQGSGVTTMTEAMAETTRMAIVIFSIAPIMCVYPFLQKYFAKGVLIGAVKS